MIDDSSESLSAVGWKASSKQLAVPNRSDMLPPCRKYRFLLTENVTQHVTENEANYDFENPIDDYSESLSAVGWKASSEQLAVPNNEEYWRTSSTTYQQGM